jgi:hypothetical protein
MKAEFKTITPAMAEYYLSKNVINRKVREVAVRDYYKLITSGNFFPTHQGIAFYKDGTLADGQHRLLAIVRANKCVKLLVTTGLDKEAAVAIDVHRKRTMVDGLRIGEISDWIDNRHIAMANLIAGGRRLNQPEIIAFLEHIAESAQFATTHLNVSKRHLMNASIHSAVALAHFYGEDPDDLARFCQIFVSGLASEPRDSAIIKLRDEFYNNTGGGSSDKRDKYLKAHRAIQAYLSHEIMKRLSLPKEEVWPFDWSVIDEANK